MRDRVTPTAVERRRAERRPAHGVVRLWTEPLYAEPVEAVLIDRSDCGFRARHRAATLTAGQVVRWEVSGIAGGMARVVWSRVFGPRVESGFAIVPTPEDAAAVEE